MPTAQFDYIIVGAGSAGCVLANRLTEDEACQVLLVEAGGEARTRLAAIPGAASWLQGTELDWAFTTTPQPELFDRRIAYPRGRAIGGSSILHYMVYTRGNKGDYDGWEALGNKGWSYDNVLPYFRRAESNATFIDEYHGSDGPLCVETNLKRHPLCQAFIEAAQAVGLPFNSDFNGAKQHGCGYYQATVRDGERCSAASAYIDPIRSRPNLSLIPNALVTRIVFASGRARGIEYIADGRRSEIALASSEIICAAGAIGSPHLLMLSGVGPADHLRRHGIEVVVDLPGVGQDLQDHLGNGSVGVSLRDPEAFFSDVPRSRADALAQYETTRKGLLATHHLDAGAFHLVDGDDWPSLQTFFSPGIAEFYRSDGVPETQHAYLGGYVCRPKSRGAVTLASGNPLDRPVINPCYLAEPDDMRLSKELVRRDADILTSGPFRDICLGDVVPQPGNEAEIETFIRRNATTIWHPTSSCRMGVDDRSAVTPNLLVRGVDGLRIADASVMPCMVSGNTNAPVIMIAEKAADIIRGLAPRPLTPAAKAVAGPPEAPPADQGLSERGAT